MLIFDIFATAREVSGVFTTAYDKYILERFEFTSIDYLLKPIPGREIEQFVGKSKKT